MADNKGYKRSWRNYLLDSNYQLRFTFTMLAIAAGLMAPLGWWVSQKSATASEVAINKIDEIDCPEVLSNDKPAAAPTPTPVEGSDTAVETDLLQEPAPEADEEPPEEPSLVDDSANDDATDDDDAPDDDATDDKGEGEELGEGERERPRIKVTIDDSNMPDPVVVVGEIEATPATPEEIANSRKAREACLANVAARKSAVRDRKSLITEVMVGSALLLLVILAVYGIKTTHRVAGPLHKVGLYLGKLENNVYDTVYNLRKGDQLVEFYDHFKGAHKGLTKLQEEDRDRLREAIALAKEAGLADKSAELAELIPELERLLAEKEESFVKKQA